MAKRAIQLTWVNPEEEPRRTTYRSAGGYPRPDIPIPSESSVDVHEIIKTTAKEIGTVVCWYILADTCRRIIVSRLGGK
jgi:hypothetical protein